MSKSQELNGIHTQIHTIIQLERYTLCAILIDISPRNLSQAISKDIGLYSPWFFRAPDADRKPTVSWSWEKRKTTVSTTQQTSSTITLTNFYFPSTTSSSDSLNYQTTVSNSRPTRPTRPPKPSSVDLVTYFPPLKNKPIPTMPTLTTISTTTVKTSTTTKRTTVKTTTKTTTKRPTTTLRPLNPVVTKKPQKARSGGCGLPQRGPNCPKGRIVNGTQSCYGQFPWQVIFMILLLIPS